MIRYQSADCLGTIEENTDIGIYGKLYGNIVVLARGDDYNICYKQDIKQGPATIICGFTGEKKEYAIEIESLDYSGREANKGILFRVTDEQLFRHDRRYCAGNEWQSHPSGWKNNRRRDTCLCLRFVHGLWDFY